MGKSIIKNCSCCNKEIKVIASRNASKNFCSRPCRDKVMYQHKFCGDAELLEMIKTHSIKQISQIFGATLKNTYRRVNKVKALTHAQA
jgi:hypothetical protein